MLRSVNVPEIREKRGIGCAFNMNADMNSIDCDVIQDVSFSLLGFWIPLYKKSIFFWGTFLPLESLEFKGAVCPPIFRKIKTVDPGESKEDLDESKPSR